jgi:hypothetical protein
MILHIVLQDPAIQWTRHAHPVAMYLNKRIEPFTMDAVMLLLWLSASFLFIHIYLFSSHNLVC